ncbi:MAG: twin-arginine translocase TatA/TatE family subunit [Solirubrobacterales bacterium]|nr:twin-arginine translocase TatA/TatE family subunit [Solirubrobacterales bacterium]MBV9683509.1 twin-arginine translocase TatA/TatE family subunit [Solirubrobacterales bacterium]MBV9810423.1 twin-arginine translocase TatA/TatE family subunit [Solirubrobacterales bacterium]
MSPGPRRLPQAGRALGRSLHEFRQRLAGRDPTALDPQPDDADRR